MNRRHFLPLLLCLLAAAAIQAAVVVGRPADSTPTTSIASATSQGDALSDGFVCTACGPIRSISPTPQRTLATDVVANDSRQ